MNRRTILSDVLVLGAGVAGLRAAAAAAERGLSVAVVSNGQSASPEILGLNAPVRPEDSLQAYCEDTMISGCQLNDEELVRVLGKTVMDELAWLEKIGVRFSREPDGSFTAMQTLGARCPRLVRSGTASGATEAKALLSYLEGREVQCLRSVDILGLVLRNGRAVGAYGMNAQGQLLHLCAKCVVLATGGSGAIRSFTTYPHNLVGDGYALAYLAGARLRDMEFQQFEPCCLAWPEHLRGKIMVTTLMRRGATLLNGERKPFLENYGLNADNAQKGELARAILKEIQAGRGTPHGGVYFDLTMLSDKVLYEQHKLFTAPVRAAGINLKKEYVEVVPAAHTQLGGIVIGPDCSTDVEGLFVCGEASGGLHGANRVGGNAGAEVVVFGRIAGESAATYASVTEALTKKEETACWAKTEEEILSRFGGSGKASLYEIRVSIDKCMTEKVGPFRDAAGITAALEKLDELEYAIETADVEDLSAYAQYVHCRNILLVSRLQAMGSALRQESRGVFFRTDFPAQDDKNWKKTILFQCKNGHPSYEIRSVL